MDLEKLDNRLAAEETRAGDVGVGLVGCTLALVLADEIRAQDRRQIGGQSRLRDSQVVERALSRLDTDWENLSVRASKIQEKAARNMAMDILSDHTIEILGAMKGNPKRRFWYAVLTNMAANTLWLMLILIMTFLALYFADGSSFGEAFMRLFRGGTNG
jgi:hypothetical protein